jgi:hypothetical protein
VSQPSLLQGVPAELGQPRLDLRPGQALGAALETGEELLGGRLLDLFAAQDGELGHTRRTLLSSL